MDEHPRDFLVRMLLLMEFGEGEHMTRAEAEELVDRAEAALAAGRFVQVTLEVDEDEGEQRGPLQ